MIQYDLELQAFFVVAKRWFRFQSKTKLLRNVTISLIQCDANRGVEIVLETRPIRPLEYPSHHRLHHHHHHHHHRRRRCLLRRCAAARQRCRLVRCRWWQGG